MSADRAPSAVSAEEVSAYFETLDMDVAGVTIEVMEQDYVRCRWTYDGDRTRPGGYIPGPTQMMLVDLVVWVAVFTRAGIAPMAVTSELAINFLRPAVGGDLIAEAHLRKYGRLSYADVTLHIDGKPDKLVSSAKATYAVPDDVLALTRP